MDCPECEIAMRIAYMEEVFVHIGDVWNTAEDEYREIGTVDIYLCPNCGFAIGVFSSMSPGYRERIHASTYFERWHKEHE